MDRPHGEVDMNTLTTVGWVNQRDGRILAVRTHGRNAFYLPGGKIESGETYEQALVREIREELRLDLQTDTLRPVATISDTAHAQLDVRLEMHCYTGIAHGDIRPSREIAEYAWLGLQDTGRCAPAVQQVLRTLFR
jgi:ADP-ribose pyrophosphatase YjhB (NUDIX family)